LFGYKHLYRNNLKFSLILDDIQIDEVEYAKFVGVYIVNKLNWKKHMEYIRLKIFRGLGIMSRVRYLPRVIMKLLKYIDLSLFCIL